MYTSHWRWSEMWEVREVAERAYLRAPHYYYSRTLLAARSAYNKSVSAMQIAADDADEESDRLMDEACDLLESVGLYPY